MNIIENVFEWMLAATLRASVLAVVILCIQLALRRWLPAGWRHALWLPMVAVLVLPVLPESPFGLFPLKRDIAVALPEVEMVAGASLAEEIAPVAPPVAVEAKVNYLALAWLAGACGMSVAGLLGYRRNLARVRAMATRPHVDLAEDIEISALQAGLKRAPEVIVSPAVNSPAVTGFLRPVLLLPAGFPEGFTGKETRLILLHEFSHLKRLDLPLNWLVCVLQALHWFNPLLWFAFARMRADREAACDARVLSLDTMDNRSQYGGALLKLQCVAPTRGMSLGFVGIFERGSEMKARIRDISTHRPRHFAWQAAGGVILTGLTMFGVTRAAQEEVALPSSRAVAADGDGLVAGADSDVGGAVYIMKKLDKIVVPKAEWENATLVEVAEFLMSRVRDLDVEEKNPALKGVNIVVRQLKPGQPAYRNITLKVRNMTLRKLMQEIAKQSGTHFMVDDFAVTFFPEGDKGSDFVRMPEEKPNPGGQAGGEEPGVILARVNFEEISLMEAVQQLNAMAKEAAKGKPVPRVVLDGSGDPAAKVRELRLRNVPLSIAVGYCVEQVKHKVVAKEGELRITKDVAPPAAAPGAEKKPAARAEPAGNALEAANKIVIERVEFLNSTLKEQVDFLNLRAKEFSRDRPFFPIVIDPAVDATIAVNRELRLRNVPLSVALKYCLDGTGLAFTANDREIRISKKP